MTFVPAVVDGSGPVPALGSAGAARRYSTEEEGLRRKADLAISPLADGVVVIDIREPFG